ncbi:MAG: BamA/TamA family outer membrane protein [Bacteroidia bacterium]|nr:BamA/TamA family outer membrane protein [Bacteroidia bacterium]
MEIVAVWDSRDNVLNAQDGFFAEIKQGFYQKFLGGTNQFRFLQTDIRNYWQPWKRKDDILAFHILGRFSWGNVPLGELSDLGGAENARGYQEGRYRDNHVITTQLEYRWQTWDRVGLVFFVEAGDVFENFQSYNFAELKYGVGVGLRLKIVKEENLNIRFDFGLGLGHQAVENYYLDVAEAF